MTERILEIADYQIKVYELDTAVVGTGAAGFNAADRLYQYGEKDIAIITEGINAGTSRNTGSDKQTYYKLTLSGNEEDSVIDMATTLFSGGCMDGDIALCESAMSVRSFTRLVELGMPFPENQYGEFVGYKTDHDPHHRGTSIGPYTSKYMTECLQKAVKGKNIRIFDKMQAIYILSDSKRAYGVICLDYEHIKDENKRFVVFKTRNIIWCTGGPAGMYEDSVYPSGHFGATGLMLEAGALGRNLTEWQYGLGSVYPRWNVSGTYMQAMPRVISTDKDGGDEKEFLNNFFTDKYEMLNKLFLKGYQWPFDVNKVCDGSSIIDILVYIERRKGRKVYLDYRSNPGGKEIEYGKLNAETFSYLNSAGACYGTPYDRLKQMNAPAVEFYKKNKIDLQKEPLEIALCVQHNNGGIAVDAWWKTNIEGLFCAGEAAGTHGVCRPGGSALNSGQVGSSRAAKYISKHKEPQNEDAVFYQLLRSQVPELKKIAENSTKTGTAEVMELWKKSRHVMSLWGAAFRSETGLEQALKEINTIQERFKGDICVNHVEELKMVYRLREQLISQKTYLEAMLDYIREGGASRGSALYTDVNGIKPYKELPDEFTFSLDAGNKSDLIQEIKYSPDKCTVKWRKVHPVPKEDYFFENVWKSYRES